MTRKLPVEQELADGSYLSTIRPTGVSVEQAKARAITARVIDYVLPNMPDAQPHYRLITTLLASRIHRLHSLESCSVASGNSG